MEMKGPNIRSRESRKSQTKHRIFLSSFSYSVLINSVIINPIRLFANGILHEKYNESIEIPIRMTVGDGEW